MGYYVIEILNGNPRYQYVGVKCQPNERDETYARRMAAIYARQSPVRIWHGTLENKVLVF